MKKILFSLACAMMLLTACDNYLDVKPYGRTIPKTAEEFAALIHNRLNELDQGSNNYLIASASDMLNYDLGGGDDFEASLTEQSGRTLPFYAGSLLGQSARQPYIRLYEVIKDCNILLDNLEETQTAESQHIRATAHAMRAVCYYNLMRLYCEAPQQANMAQQQGMPLVTRFDMEERPVRSTLEQTAKLIETDLQTAISLKNDSAIYRFTTDVSKAYLARLYFWTEQWSKAVPLLTELLQKYPLLEGDDYRNMVKHPLGNNNNHLVKAYMAATSNDGTEYNAQSQQVQYRPVSKRFLNCFAPGEESTDVRYALYVNKKRKAQKPLFCGVRAAELKLMLAECYYHLGNNNEALTQLNELRAKRISPFTPYTLETLPQPNASELIKKDAQDKALTPLMAAIENERRKELFMEGDRFFELKRNGCPTFWTAFNGRKYTTLAYMYTFPLPQSEVQINPAIVQNPGYTELISR